MESDRNNVAERVREVIRAFLKIGAMSYGGPAIMGIMQAELQEKRQWVSKERFVEGLALVNTLPGPGATQLGIFIGHTRAGWQGGIAAGLSFMLPAFLIMLALAAAYTHYGALPALRNAFYGIGPVVVGVFAVAVLRLAMGIVKDIRQVALVVVAAAAMAVTPLGIIPTILLGGALGIALYDSRKLGIRVGLAVALAVALYAWFEDGRAIHGVPALGAEAAATPPTPALWEIGYFFLKVGAFTFGGGLSVLAFMEDQVVNQLHWLTAREFVDGLALGQLTPGPILMLAAFVGYKLYGVVGALVAGIAIFLPCFVVMLSVIPALDRVKQMTWLKAFMRGAGPAVIGAISVSVGQMVPHAAPNAWTLSLLGITVLLMTLWRIAPLPLMLGGAASGMLVRTKTAERLRELAP
jgi:chromate transporter